MSNLDKRDMPIYLIVLSLIIVFPLGIYFIVLKTKYKLQNVKETARILTIIGITGLVVLLIYFLVHYSYYVSLVDSHMSIDMYNFSFIYVYSYLLMITISCLVAGYILNKLCEKYIVYTEFINVHHIKDLQLIQEETMESLDEVKANVNKLIEKGYLINVKIVDDHIISTKTVGRKGSSNLVKCKTCGNIKKMQGNMVRCDFCFRKLTKKDKM